MELSRPAARAARCEAFAGLRPGSEYTCHPLHSAVSPWTEKNCYIDIWIEMLHSLKLDPLPLLPFTLTTDFVGDQWTFYKPPHNEVYELYGIDVQELNVWRPLAEHAMEHLSAGRAISTESDAWWLPDTAGTDYRRQHTKTTIVLTEADFDAGVGHYFHSGGFHRLDGEDFRQVFRLDAPAEEVALPLFAETVCTDRLVRRPVTELVQLSRHYLVQHVARRPRTNPVHRFAQRWSADAPLLQSRGLAHYHAWAFATLRQLGSSFELAARNLEWLASQGEAELAPAVPAFDLIANSSKTLILKGARSVMAGKPLEVGGQLGEMAAAWDRGMETVASYCGA